MGFETVVDKSDDFRKIGTVSGHFKDSASTFRTGDSITDKALALLEEEGFALSEALMPYPFIFVKMTADKSREMVVLIASRSYPATLKTGQTINEPIIFRENPDQETLSAPMTAQQYIQSRQMDQVGSQEPEKNQPKP